MPSFQEDLLKILRQRRGSPEKRDGKTVYTVRCRKGELRAILPFARAADGAVIRNEKGATPETRAADAAPSNVISISGVASSTSEDWYGTQMSPACLLGMQEQFNRGVSVFPSHGSWFESMEWDSEMGRTVEATLEQMPMMEKEGEGPGYCLRVKSDLRAKLPKCQELADRLEDGQKIGMSIGGWFTEIRYIYSEDEQELEAIIVESVELDHLAITRNPANPDSCDLSLLRSVMGQIRAEDDVTDFPKKGDNKKISLKNSEYPQFDRKYAEDLKANYGDIWEEGGNIRGNEAYALWGRAIEGDDAQEVLDWIKEREAWAARHYGDHLLPGVVAQVKWGVIGELGESGMKDLINEEKKKMEEKSAPAPTEGRASTPLADPPLAPEDTPENNSADRAVEPVPVVRDVATTQAAPASQERSMTPEEIQKMIQDGITNGVQQALRAAGVPQPETEAQELARLRAEVQAHRSQPNRAGTAPQRQVRTVNPAGFAGLVTRAKETLGDDNLMVRTIESYQDALSAPLTARGETARKADVLRSNGRDVLADILESADETGDLALFMKLA